MQSAVTNKLKLDAERHKQKTSVHHQIDHLFNYDRESYAKLREPPAQFIQALNTYSIPLAWLQVNFN